MTDAPPLEGKEILWLFDSRPDWRQRICHVLGQAGLDIRSWGQYRFPPLPSDADAPTGPPRLVIVACTTVGDEELRLVERIAEASLPILVLPSWGTERQMRLLFRAGAYDVCDMPAQGQGLLNLIRQTLAEAPDPSHYEPLLATRARP